MGRGDLARLLRCVYVRDNDGRAAHSIRAVEGHIAFGLYLCGLALSVVRVVYYVVARPDAVKPTLPAQAGSIFGWFIYIAILVYIWHLRRNSTLR